LQETVRVTRAFYILKPVSLDLAVKIIIIIFYCNLVIKKYTAKSYETRYSLTDFL